MSKTKFKELLEEYITTEIIIMKIAWMTMTCVGRKWTDMFKKPYIHFSGYSLHRCEVIILIVFEYKEIKPEIQG